MQPAPVTARLGVVASLYTALAVVAVAVLLGARRRHDRVSAPILIGLYALSYVVLISAD